jgi:hypothetical protein
MKQQSYPGDLTDQKGSPLFSDDRIARPPLINAINVHALRWHGRWHNLLFSPLWICLLLALILRVWLVIHTHGVIDGDEAMVGIQAQHILRGERPIYYYSQAYMGSLEAYLVALLFALAGSSVWTLRAEPILLSLVAVWLTWKMAAALAEAAHLPDYARQRFQLLAALFAAILPLYDTVIELRTLGGYIETFVLMLLLLLSTLRLTQRWHAGASTRELALRWAGIGFVVGLGFWVNPLIISPVAASGIWIAGYCIVHLVTRRQPPMTEPRHPLLSTLQGLSLVVAAIPASLIGFAPALYWGATHHWININYILNNGGDVSANRFAAIGRVVHLYTTCVAPRILGGALPAASITAVHARLFTFGLGIAMLYLLATITASGLSLIWHQPLLVCTRQLASLPLLFGACSAAIFCISRVSTAGLPFNCMIIDNVGRFATPLMLALPFLFATLVTIISMYLHEKGRQLLAEERRPGTAQRASAPVLSRTRLPQVILFLVIALYFGVQCLTYVQTNAGYTFQTSGCTAAPANNDPIMAYMRHWHIHYAWASFWIGNPIMFKSNGEIILADPRIITIRTFGNRIPANTTAVLHAVHPSVLTLISSYDAHPQLLQALDAEKLKYQVARFPSEPGFDLLIVTPLNHPISPFTASSLGAWFAGC